MQTEVTKECADRRRIPFPVFGQRSICARRMVSWQLAASILLLTWFSYQPQNLFGGSDQPGQDLQFTDGTFAGWHVEGEGTWHILLNPAQHVKPGDPPRHVATSLAGGEEAMGLLRSEVFTVTKCIQRFSLCGADGTATATNDGSDNFLLLRSHPDGKILRRARPPGLMPLVAQKWLTYDLIGQKVYLELVDNNPKRNPGGFAWIGLADYRQADPPALLRPVACDNLFGLKIDATAELAVIRTIPFLAASPANRVKSSRVNRPGAETIPVGTQATEIYLAGMINEGWDNGVAHWGEHPELRKTRNDQISIGTRIGDIDIQYVDGSKDRIPVIIGATAWFVAQWGHGPSHGVTSAVREPFASRAEYAAVFNRAMRIKESTQTASTSTRHLHYYLALTPRPQPIESIVIHDNPAVRGRPLVSAITLAGAAPSDNLHPFGKWQADEDDLAPAIDTAKIAPMSADIKALAKVLYTFESDLPKEVALLQFPKEMDAAKIRFRGDVMADMLSNMWVANLVQISEKFDRDSGFFHESGKDYPWYGGYSGIGTWAPIGVYYSGAFPRCSDHFASLALRCVNDPQRNVNFVDFVDKYFYFYRDNHDPAKGPPNAHLAVDKYPAGVPGHWGFSIPPGGPPVQINEIPGEEEMDGHGATIVARWLVWRTFGKPKGEWLTQPRKAVFGKSRWDTTRDAAEFICWLMDYTGMDVMWSEGEVTGWGGPYLNMVPAGMKDETDPARIRANYANSVMYQPYPTYVCLTALRCASEMADAADDKKAAAKWIRYADRLQQGMLRQLVEGDHGSLTWIQSRYSVLPSLQDSLVQAWFSIYRDGLDPKRLHPQMTAITRNTLKRQLSYPYGHRPVLAMGYGMGWITKAALILDEFDDAGPLLINIAKYSYDKNMDYVDKERDIDWRKFLWLVPEGTNLLSDGSWYRIGDLTNGANQGPAMHALELCAGIDDTDPADLKILPRAPAPLTGLDVTDFLTLVPDGNGLTRAKVSYQFDKATASFSLESDIPLPTLSVRLGPFDEPTARTLAATIQRPASSSVRVESSGRVNQRAAWWLWIEKLKGVSKLQLRRPVAPQRE